MEPVVAALIAIAVAVVILCAAVLFLRFCCSGKRDKGKKVGKGDGPSAKAKGGKGSARASRPATANSQNIPLLSAAANPRPGSQVVNVHNPGHTSDEECRDETNNKQKQSVKVDVRPIFNFSRDFLRAMRNEEQARKEEEEEKDEKEQKEAHCNTTVVIEGGEQVPIPAKQKPNDGDARDRYEQLEQKLFTYI